MAIINRIINKLKHIFDIDCINEERFEVALEDVLSCLDDKEDFNYNANLSTTIIIPVYNGYHHLENLFPSLVKNTKKEVKVIIVDDCSNDKNTIEIINKYINENKNWSLIKNDKNYGFVHSINVAMKEVKTDIAIWLNSDTIVPEYWLERLIEPFELFQDLATTTPFTNSGVTFSYPKYCENNELKYPLNVIDNAFRRVKTIDESLNNTYSGTGFCMTINMKVWKDIGQLNEEEFGKGYGEENDWCFRALLKGYKHKIVPNLFVEHRHGGSFNSDEKIKLSKEHGTLLNEKYPEIMNKTVPEFLLKDPWKAYRSLVSLLLSSSSGVILIKSYKTLKNLYKDNTNNSRNIVLNYIKKKDKWFLRVTDLDEKCFIFLKNIDELQNIIKTFKINKIEFDNLDSKYKTKISKICENNKCMFIEMN